MTEATRRTVLAGAVGGCGLSSVENGLIHCQCHGATFAVADGSVRGGPAKTPLAAKNIQVDGQSITLP